MMDGYCLFACFMELGAVALRSTIELAGLQFERFFPTTLAPFFRFLGNTTADVRDPLKGKISFLQSFT
jgi:hypothetical protein